MSNSETPWEFVPEDDDVGGEGRSAEELAMHVDSLRRRRRARDLGLSDVDVGRPETEALTGIGHLPDEEAELAEGAPADDHEPDVQELLESQGYAFAEETEEAEPGGIEATDRWRRHLEEERQRLVDLRRDVTDELPTGEHRGDTGDELSSVDQHQADAASMTYELEAEQALLRQIDDGLRRVEAAFGRLDAGTYGSCERCGGQIGDERLRALPAARFCVAHERAAGGTLP
jgi:RNA polymerase-binding transcription factor DksA